MTCPVHAQKCCGESCAFYTLVEDTKTGHYVKTGCGLAMLLQQTLVKSCVVEAFRFEVNGNADWEQANKMAEI